MYDFFDQQSLNDRINEQLSNNYRYITNTEDKNWAE